MLILIPRCEGRAGQESGPLRSWREQQVLRGPCLILGILEPPQYPSALRKKRPSQRHANKRLLDLHSEWP